MPTTEPGAGAGAPVRPPSPARLVLLVLEGYLWLAVVIAVFVGTAVLLVLGLLSRRPVAALAAVFVGVPLLVTTAAAIRSLFVGVPEPEGVAVTSVEAPALYAEVERIRRELGAPPLERVIVINRFNASTLQLPRFGVFWPRNILLIGFPLFEALTPLQLRAVIAHELGHLSRAHGRLSLLVYRLRLQWMRLLATLDARRMTPTLAIVLFRWYTPRLYKHSTAIAQRHEFLADQLAARIAGANVAATTLVMLGIVGPAFEEHLGRSLWVEGQGAPDFPRPFGASRTERWHTVIADAEARMAEEMDGETSDGDTHPSLRDRLAAVGNPSVAPTLPEHSAGDEFLGSFMATIAERLDAQWAAAYGAEWRRRNEVVRAQRGRLAELEGLPDPTPDRNFERAQLLASLEGAEAALPYYQSAVDAGHAGAMLALGSIFLDRDDEQGVSLIERAIAADVSLTAEGSRRLATFLSDHGRLTEAHRHATRAKGEATRDLLAQAERNELTVVDRFLPHRLSEAEVARMVPWLERESAIAQALVVTKALRHSVGEQTILAVVANGAPVAPLAERLRSALALPPNGRVVVLGRADEPLRQALAATPRAQVYTRR